MNLIKIWNFKKVLKIILFFSSFFLCINSWAASIPVENVFWDISTDYKYYNELQVLYDRWMIFPDEDWNFNPERLLNRDEFMWIMTEVTCTNCISPNTSYDLVEKYESNPIFYDIDKTNKYYYCISSAEDKWFVKWYQPWTLCENWSWWKEWIPFCPNNAIILEEALAIILRASWILNNFEAEIIRQKILSWEITNPLSDDVSPLNEDWSVYSFYPDFMKALEYELLEFDKKWNKKTYNLVQKIDNKLNPKKTITKEDFLYIAYVSLKANSCIETKESDLVMNIVFYPISCNEETVEKCTPSSLEWASRVYDLYADVEVWEWDYISNDNQYIWRVYDYNTVNNLNTENQFYWKYIDSYNFWDWDYRVYLRVVTDNGDTMEVYNDINFWWKKISISKRWNYVVDFNWIVSWLKSWDSFLWNFWDWTTWYWKYKQHIYKTPWHYNVSFTVTDENWNSRSATTTHFTGTVEALSTTDTDWDWVFDIDDLCPTIKGPKENKWCPVYNKQCSVDRPCPSGQYCSWWICKKTKENLNSCEYSWWDLIIWNVICDTCPCENTIDFSTTIRKCDLVFPAITSPDGKEIYSKWDLYQIK